MSVENVKAFASAQRYIQGAGVINELKNYAEKLGKKAYILITPSANLKYGSVISEIFKDFTFLKEEFHGIVSISNVEKYIANAKDYGADVVIAVGGGRCIDSCKIIADKISASLVIVPTIASTDAPTSALSVIYSDEGEHICEMTFDRSPDIILVDTEIIIKAPVRLLVAGMGDALATYFEARACYASDSFTNMDGFKSTLASRAIAKACYTSLLENYDLAIASARSGVITTALENIIEVNTLLSGIGAESNGASGAHAFHDGFTALKETDRFYHGEKVAFGVICQLVLENAPKDELNEVLTVLKNTGLPMTLEDIGVTDKSEEKIRKVAKAVMKSPLIRKEPFLVTEDMVYGAILTADTVGRSFPNV